MKDFIEFLADSGRTIENNCSACDQSAASGRFVMQWHITDECGLNCLHCYRAPGPAVSTPPNLIDTVIGQFVELSDLLERKYRIYAARSAAAPVKFRAHINITGGEPFARSDIFDILHTLHERRADFSYGILTNGMQISDGVARDIGALKPGFVQISVEGAAAVHDSIRGAGSFARAYDAIVSLKKYGVRTIVSFTAHRNNYRDFAGAFEMAEKAGADMIWADRLAAFGRASETGMATLNAPEAEEFLDIMADCAARRSIFSRSRTAVSMGRALQFLRAGGSPYRCPAGAGLITVMPDGSLYPCRRLPVDCGNIFERSMTDIYQNSTVLETLRARREPPSECSGCAFENACRGGARCIAYAETGDMFAKDPGCWIKSGRERIRR